MLRAIQSSIKASSGRSGIELVPIGGRYGLTNVQIFVLGVVDVAVEQFSFFKEKIVLGAVTRQPKDDIVATELAWANSPMMSRSCHPGRIPAIERCFVHGKTVVMSRQLAPQSAPRQSQIIRPIDWHRIVRL
jgi:hypothetical protein